MAYADLKTAISSWTAKSNLSTILDDCVTLAEAKFNRRLRTNQMEAVMSSTAIVNDVIARPAGMIEFKTLWVTGDQQKKLEPRPLEDIVGQPPIAASPRYYAWDQGNLRFYPSQGSVQGVYYTNTAALSVGDNWLYLANPDLYLWGSLEQAYIWLHDDANEAKFRALTDNMIEELNRRSRAAQYSGPIVMRAR